MVHFKRIIDLISTGRLDDELQANLLGTISCIGQAIGELCALLDPDHVHPIGDSARSVNDLLQDFARATSLDLPASQLGPEDDSIQIHWIELVLPILLKLLERWVARK